MSDTPAALSIHCKNTAVQKTVFVDGVRYIQDIGTIDSSIIESISVLQYDPEYPGGVIKIITKKNKPSRNNITTENREQI